ncbi:MAG: SprT family zinc-dependent metalloprotease [Burkholderiaceae bacterium]
MRALLQYTLDLFGVNTDTAPTTSRSDPVSPTAGKPAPQDSTVAGPLRSPVLAEVLSRHPLANRETRLGSARIAYLFKRGKRRTIGFSVSHDGLVVHAPRWVALTDVQSALNEKADWIVRKLVETRERQNRMLANRIDWKDGAIVPFLGEPMQVVLDPHHAFDAGGAVLNVMKSGEGEAGVLHQLRLGLPRHASADQIRDAVQAWLMRQAKRLFAERLDHFAPRLQVQWRKMSLSSAGTRWGSARADGSIRLHWRLIHFRASVIDYVVVHELSHLRVMDHSPRFWDTVRTIVPDYQNLRGQLKEEAIPKWV